MKEEWRRTRAGLPTLLLSSLLIVSCASKTGVREVREPTFIDTAKGRMVELPAGFEIGIRLLDALSSETAQNGHKFRSETAHAVSARNTIIVPKGSPVTGTVEEVKPPKMHLIKAKIKLHFDGIEVEDRHIPIDAYIDKSMTDMAVNAGKSAGQSVGKKITKRVFPVTGPVFLTIDIINGVKYVFSDKDVTLEPGSEMEIELEKPALIPY